MQTQLVKKTAIIESGDFNLSANRYLEKIVINSNFQIVNVSQVAEFVRGITFSKNDTYDETGLGVLRANNIDINGSLNLNDVKHINPNLDFSDNKKLLKNDIFICTASGSKKHIGKVAFIEQNYDFYFGGFMGVLRSNDLILPKYLFQILHSSFFRDFLFKTLNSLTINNLNKKVFENFEFPLPPLEIQEQIVKEIEAYQQIIDGCRQVVENYKPVIDIDPSWEKSKLGNICDVRDGTHDSPKYMPSGYPLITSKNIKNNLIDFENVNFISLEDFKKINKRSKVDIGDIVMPMIGSIGNPIVIETNKEFAIKNVALIKFYDNSPVNYFVKYILSSTLFIDYLDRQTVGSTQKFISLKKLRGFLFPLPTKKQQKEIVEKLEQERKVIEGNKKLIQIYEKKINDKIKELF